MNTTGRLRRLIWPHGLRCWLYCPPWHQNAPSRGDWRRLTAGLPAATPICTPCDEGDCTKCEGRVAGCQCPDPRHV